MERLLKQFGVRRKEEKTRSSCNLCKSCDNLLSISSKKSDLSPCSLNGFDLSVHLPVRVLDERGVKDDHSVKMPPLTRAKRAIGALANKNIGSMQNVEAHLLEMCERAKVFGNPEEDNELYRSNSFRFQRGRQKNIIKQNREVPLEDNYAFPLDLVVKRKPLAPVRTISIQRERKVRVTEAYEDPSDSKYYCEPGEDRLAKIYGDAQYSQPYLELVKFNRTGRQKDANDNAYEDICTSYDYDSADRLVTRVQISKLQEEQETLIDLVYEDEYIEDRLSDLVHNNTEYDNELYFSQVVPEYAKVDPSHLKKKRINKQKRYSVACDENFERDGTLRKSAFDQVYKLNIPVGNEYSSLVKEKALSSCPTLIDEPYYECVVVGGDNAPLLDDICQILTAKQGLDRDFAQLISTMRHKEIYETAFDSRSRSGGQNMTPGNETTNSILRRFWKSKNKTNKLSPSETKVDNEGGTKLPRSRRIDNFAEEKNSETSVTKNDNDTCSIYSFTVTPPSSVPLVPKFKKLAMNLENNERSINLISREMGNLEIDKYRYQSNNKNQSKNRYASSDSMGSSSSTVSSLESIRSSASDSARSTSSSLSSHNSDDHSKKRQNLSLDLPSRANQSRVTKPSMTLSARKFQQILSPISDKSQDVSSENKGFSTSPDDSEQTKTEDKISVEKEVPKKPSRKSLSLQLSAGNYPYVTVQSDHASDSGISLGPTKEEQGCDSVPFAMPKLRRRGQTKIGGSKESHSARSSPNEELPFPMPKLRRRPNSLIR
ncbi:hypothetical protein QYM36_017108 [Artemia franciscana]|uniref:Uncharacterized protein n=1 Tax=Artemia franciscana TaxID=6661 RepID=A0AA88H9N1_ARTSF|nr:hypothetical protein QYM36_017108 [Artemia franciscana]